MNLSNIDRVRELSNELNHTREVLAAFERMPGDTVPACAHTSVGGYRGHSVVLLPVAKSVAVSAAKREVSKVIEQLAHLGVEVDEAVFSLPAVSVPQVHDLTLPCRPSTPTFFLSGGN